MKNFLTILIFTFIIFLLFAITIFAYVWDYSCERAIKNLKDTEKYSQLNSAKSDVESARFSYNLCTPSEWDDCEFERTRLNNAIDEYNDAFTKLKDSLSEFEYYIGKFNFYCLE